MERKAFKGNEHIESVVLSDTLKIVGDSAFMQTSLKEVTISDSVTEIKQYGFAYCTQMEVLHFGNPVETIGDLAFNGSWSLKLHCELEKRARNLSFYTDF